MPCRICEAYARNPNKAAVGMELGVSRSAVWRHISGGGCVEPGEFGERRRIVDITNERIGMSTGEEVYVRTYAPRPPSAPVIRPEGLRVDFGKYSGPVLWGSDFHLPWVHRPAFDAFCEYAEDLKAGLFINGGDLHDFHSISRHEKEDAILLQEEVDLSRPYIERLDSLPGRKVLLMGNHDVRSEALASQVPALRGLEVLDYGMVAGIPLGWEVYCSQVHFKVGGEDGLVFLHGDLKGAFKGGGKHIAESMREYLRSSCLFGNFHRHDTAPVKIGYSGDPIWEGHCIGWMGDAQGCAKYMRKPNWSVGFATVWFDDDTFHVEHHVWKRNHFLIRGRRYG